MKRFKHVFALVLALSMVLGNNSMMPSSTVYAQDVEPIEEVVTNEQNYETNLDETPVEEIVDETEDEIQNEVVEDEIIDIEDDYINEGVNEDVKLRQPVNQLDLGPYIKKEGTQITVNGVDISTAPAESITKDAAVKGKIAFDLSKKDAQGYQQPLYNGAKITYQIPYGITITERQTGRVTDGGTIAGNFVIETNGLITITLNDNYFPSGSGVIKAGSISFNGQFDKNKWGQGGTQEITFGDVEIEIPFKKDPVVTKGNITINKTDGNQIKNDNDGKGSYILYTVTINAPADNTRDIENVTVSDVFTAGGSAITGLKFVSASRGNFNESTGEWTNIGKVQKGETLELKYKAYIKDSVINNQENSSTKITNKATVKENGSDKNSKEASETISTQGNLTITKSDGNTANDGKGIKTDANGRKYIDYEVKVNAPNSNTRTMTNVTVDDVFTAGADWIQEIGNVTTTKGSFNTTSRIWTIGDMAKNTTQTLKFRAYLKPSLYVAGVADTTITNKVTVKENGTEKGHVSVSENVKHKDSVSVEKTSSGATLKTDGNKKYIEYTVKVTAASDNTRDVTDINVTDVFTQGETDFIDHLANASATKGSFNTTTRQWTGIGTLKPGETATLTFRAYVKPALYASGTELVRTVGNKVEVKEGTTKKGEDTETINFENDINISKVHSGYNQQTGTVRYTITVKAPASNDYDITNVYVTDAFNGASLPYVDGYTKVNVSKGTFNTQTKRWDIGTMSPNEEVTLTYDVKINDKVFEDGDGPYSDHTLTNVGTVYYGTKHKDSTETIRFYKYWIWKSGSKVSDKKMKFTLHVNENTTDGVDNKDTFSHMFADKTITISDNLNNKAGQTNYWVYDGSVTFDAYNYGPKNTGSKVTSYTYDIDGKESFSFDLPGQYYYDVTYYARPKPGTFGSVPVSNTGSVSIDGYTHSSDWNGSNDSIDALHKNFVSKNGKTASWTSSINVDVPSGTVYTDYRNSDNRFYMTSGQVSNITVTLNGSSIKNKVTVEPAGELFKITFNEDITGVTDNNPIIIAYETTLDNSKISAGETGKFVNRGRIDYNGTTDYADAQTQYVQELKFEKHAGEFNYDKNEMTWTLVVNQTGTMLDSATVIDTLPAGMTIAKDANGNPRVRISSRGSKASDVTLGDVVKTMSEQGTEQIIIPVNGLTMADNDADALGQAHAVTIEVVTNITDPDFLAGNITEKEPMTFENTGTLYYNGDKIDSKADVNVHNKALSKTGIYNSQTAPFIEYTLVVNEHGYDMLTGASTIILEDTLSDNLILNTQSIKVVNASGENVPFEREIKGQTMRLTIPDDQKLIITYMAYVSGQIGESQFATNHATFVGRFETPKEENEVNVIISESAAEVEGDWGFYVQKENGYGEALEGAKFALYEVNANGSVNTTPIDVQTTENANGGVALAIFMGLDENKVYAFNEIEAPQGYYIDPINAAYRYVAFNRNAITPSMEGLNVLVISKGISIPAVNHRGNITVEKKFGEGDITNGTYYFGLYQNGELVSYHGKDAIASVLVENGVPTKGEFKEVPFGTYDIFETDMNGNKLQVGNDGAVVANGTRYVVTGEGAVTINPTNPNGSITITNTEKTPEVQFTATKSFVDGNPRSFDFVLGGDTEQEKSSDATTGAITFDKIPLENAGTYNYTVSEVLPDGVNEKNPTDPNTGITYDTHVYNVAVTVTETPAEGKKVSSVTVDGTEVSETTAGSGVYAITTGATFTNEFNGSATIIKGVSGGSATLAGATFELYKDDKVYATVETNADGEATVDELPTGNYYWLEKNPPKGFALDTNKYEFYIGWENLDDVTETTTVLDTPIELHVNKVTLTGLVDVADAVVELRAAADVVDENGKVVYTAGQLIDSWTSVRGDTYDFGESLVIGGSFKLVESNAPMGYAYAQDIPFTVADDGSIVADPSLFNDEGVLLITDEPFHVVFDKLDQELEDIVGADIVLYADADITYGDGTVAYKENDVIATWESNTRGQTIDFGPYIVANGSYRIEEVNAPTGVGYADPIHFTVDKFGVTNVTGGDGEFEQGDGYIYMIDTYFSVNVSKTDINGEEEVKGATITLRAAEEVKDNAGTTIYEKGADIASWKSDGRTKDFGEFLVANGKFELVETNAPTGYSYAEPIPFTIDEKGVITVDSSVVGPDGTVLVKDDAYELHVNKYDLTNTKEVAGSLIQLIAKDDVYDREDNQIYEAGQIIHEWTSVEGEDVDFGEYLVADSTFVLHEANAPTGYAYAIDIEFTVNDDGTIDGISEVVDENGVVIVDDQPYDLHVNKYEITGEDEVDGAVLGLYAVGDVHDRLEDSEPIYTDGQEIVTWTSVAGENFDFGPYLVADSTFEIREIEAPDGYGYVDPIQFTVNEDGTTSVDEMKNEEGIIEIRDKKTHIEVTKADSVSKDALKGARLQIIHKDTKEVIHEWVSDGEIETVEGKLIAGETYILHEVKAPAGYYLADDIEFTVNIKAEDQEVVMYDVKVPVNTGTQTNVFAYLAMLSSSLLMLLIVAFLQLKRN